MGHKGPKRSEKLTKWFSQFSDPSTLEAICSTSATCRWCLELSTMRWTEMPPVVGVLNFQQWDELKWLLCCQFLAPEGEKTLGTACSWDQNLVQTLGKQNSRHRHRRRHHHHHHHQVDALDPTVPPRFLNSVRPSLSWSFQISANPI